MNIIIDVNHPGHVHLFKNFAKLAANEDWKVLFTAKDKEVTLELLREENLNFKRIGKHYTSKIGKLFSLFIHVFKLFWIALFYRVDVFLSHGSVPASWVSFLLRRKYITFEDTGNMEQIKLYKPFAHAILTTESFKQDYGEKQVRYKGFHEIAYLHPEYFTPNKDIFDFLGLKTNEKYFILRFISWGASHDGDKKGLLDTEKEKIVELLANHGKVFISSEAKLPENLKQYQIKIPAHKMHDALAFAQLFVTEGLTMASECAMLGTPSILVNSMTAETIQEQEESYDLLYHLTDFNKIIEKTTQLLEIQDIKHKWKKKKVKLLNDKIDVTAFTFWFVKNYPGSMRIMKENQEYQEKFRKELILS